MDSMNIILNKTIQLRRCYNNLNGPFVLIIRPSKFTYYNINEAHFNDTYDFGCDTNKRNIPNIKLTVKLIYQQLREFEKSQCPSQHYVYLTRKTASSW